MGKGGKGGGKHYTPNDQRSMALNPNNPACQASQDNKSNQGNSNNPTFEKGRAKPAESDDDDDD